MCQIEAVRQIAGCAKAIVQWHGPELRAAGGSAKHEREQFAVGGDAAGVAVEAAGHHRQRRPAGVSGPAVQIVEWMLAAVDQVAPIGRPLTPEVAPALCGDSGSTRAPYPKYPDISGRVGRANVDGNALAVGREPRVIIAVACRDCAGLAAVPVHEDKIALGDV